MTANTGSATRCPECGEEVNAGDEFCEACGHDLATPADAKPASDTAPPATEQGTHLMAPPVRHCSCGGTFDADGWCTTCGLREPNERDHVTEQPAPDLAAACDRGLVHPRNEDAFALAVVQDRKVLVVCDGVTSATDSDVAALAAAQAARDALQAAPACTERSPAAHVEHWQQQLVAATQAAQAAAMAAAAHVGATDNPPSCTFVAAVAEGPLLATAWIGDSRAYWFADDGTATQLSTDDSWASDEIAHGMTRAAAEADPRAHAITRWLGYDSPGGDPSYLSVTATGPGWLLVCTDGLWNYCSEASALHELVSDKVNASGGDPLAAAEALVAWANAQGGHDNITAALARIEPAPSK